MTIQEQYLGMATLKDILIKGWHRRRTMTITEFRVFVAEAMELTIAQLLIEDEKQKAIPPSPRKQLDLPEMRRVVYPEVSE